MLGWTGPREGHHLGPDCNPAMTGDQPSKISRGGAHRCGSRSATQIAMTPSERGLAPTPREALREKAVLRPYRRVFMSVPFVRALRRSSLPLSFSLLLLAAACDDGEPSVTPAPTPDGDVGDASDAPDDALLEVDLGRPSEPACEGDDELAPNQTPETAWEVGGSLFQQRGLFVCAGSSDFFRVDVEAGQEISVRMRHVAALGLLNLHLYDADGPFDPAFALASSATDTDEESFRHIARDAGAYLVEVRGADGVDSGTYDLRIGVSCRDDDDCDGSTRCSPMQGGCVEAFLPTCGRDDYEPNDRVIDAAVIELAPGPARQVTGLRVCEDDEDYFVIVTEVPGTLRVELNFDAVADLDLALFDASGRRLGASETRDAPEVVELAFVPAGRYTVGVLDQVAGLGFDVDYTLAFRLTPETCSTNRQCASAAGRPVCQAGACGPLELEAPSPPGGICNTGADCEGEYSCYQGGEGIDDNLCTSLCASDAGCGFLEGGYCFPISQSQAVCLPGCSTDEDCPSFYSCGSRNRCELIECALDRDCGAGRLCRRTEQQGVGYCTAAAFPSCEVDDVWEPNDTDSAAALLPGRSPAARAATICDANDDWYAIDVDEDGTTVEVRVDFDTDVDMDVFVFTSEGRLVGAGTTPDANPEIVTLPSLASGRYLIRINQFPGVRDTLTLYNLVTEYTTARCTPDDCLVNQPIRPVCAASGACEFTNGAGTVPPGGFCDANADCENSGLFCWVFEPATSGRNVCTRQCASVEDCGDIAETAECVRFGRGFNVCLP